MHGVSKYYALTSCVVVSIVKSVITQSRLTCGRMRFRFQAAEDRLSCTEAEKSFGPHKTPYQICNLESFPGT